MEDKLRRLRTHLAEVNDLESAAQVLEWDQNTYMPAGGAPARGRQIATLRRLAHEKLIDRAIGRLLDDLQTYEESLSYGHDDASLIRITRREYERAVKVPPAFVARLHEHQSASYQAWTKARPADDFAGVRPYLERTLELSREYADFFPGYEHIADPLIDQSDYGMTAKTIRELFTALRKRLAPLVKAITAQPPADDACLRRTFPKAQQVAFALDLAQRFGYDLNRRRLDESPHPFTIEFSIGDVRITTRVNENHLGEALFSTLHEAGHGMYEQGVAAHLEGTPLAGGTSAGVHESQSRLWENVVGRSRGLGQFLYPRLLAAFPEQLGDVDPETFYRAINRVTPSLIRTEADEMTYDMHVMLRFDLELDMLEGHLEVRDLPQAWQERMAADLGIVPPDDRNGVLQDVHWYMGTIGGMFQCYTLGNILGAQFYDAALRAHPEIPEKIAAGEFATLHGWLADNIYRHGHKYTTSELVERITGGPVSIDPYVRYLCNKFGELYDL